VITGDYEGDAWAIDFAFRALMLSAGGVG